MPLPRRRESARFEAVSRYNPMADTTPAVGRFVAVGGFADGVPATRSGRGTAISASLTPSTLIPLCDDHAALYVGHPASLSGPP